MPAYPAKTVRPRPSVYIKFLSGVRSKIYSIFFAINTAVTCTHMTSAEVFIEANLRAKTRLRVEPAPGPPRSTAPSLDWAAAWSARREASCCAWVGGAQRLWNFELLGCHRVLQHGLNRERGSRSQDSAPASAACQPAWVKPASCSLSPPSSSPSRLSKMTKKRRSGG